MFSPQISEAQSKTKDRLDELMLENIQLRKKHIAKSEELAKYRANVERSSARTVQDYREKVGHMHGANMHIHMNMHMQVHVVVNHMHIACYIKHIHIHWHM